MKALIAVLPGDGIGPEVVGQGTRLLRAVAERFGHSFEMAEVPMGGVAIDLTGSPLPAETLALCQRSDAVLLGAVGGPKWDPPAKVRPEQGLLELRKALGLYANLRPVAPFPALYDASSLKPEVLRGVDLLVVRELTGGIYFGEKRRDEHQAFDACVYTVEEVVRVVRAAASLARTRRKRLTSVDKANVLETSRLWRAVTERVVREEFPDVELKHLLVDACAMHLIKRPVDFDVIVTENMFGDILTDEAAMLSGSIGMLPSASLGADRRGLYEPIHGSAPDIAGRGVANPYGTLLSVAMLLRHSLGLEQEARQVEAAVAASIEAGALTADLAPSGTRPMGTQEIGTAVLARLGERH
ncbi:3-isopropylmalate dehydrogenase [Stigmatella sp. ncwal1]|uniref:3-isopropylmalate dehydrogenase n=1 Tax=Stigmatella ashevillensis TaxID=2995309 RepID=A0ABT5D1A9_9BACT|nr:3-isopropylmalate dehydrogenase [Stigmatella ashevillena]MDC0707445.1 3-isopropylmalate dehydrogenase [Stigmatella ashevillena]